MAKATTEERKTDEYVVCRKTEDDDRGKLESGLAHEEEGEVAEAPIEERSTDEHAVCREAEKA